MKSVSRLSRRTTPRVALGVLLATGIAVSAARVRTDDPVSSSVRFTGEIVRIFDRKCQSCHGADGLAMPLSSYGDVRAWGRAIREEIVEQRMPPWSAARGFGRFRSELSLSPRETLTILSWLDGGMPRGDDRDLPRPAAPASEAPPDVRIALPPQRVPALDAHVIRRITMPAEAIDPARAIARIALVPGSRRVLRGALIYEASGTASGRWRGAWLPWQPDAAPPPSHGFRWSRGAPLVVELHYRGGDRETVDEPSLAVYYARSAQPIDELAVRAGASASLARGASVWAIVPAAGPQTSSLQVTAQRPDGSTEILLWMPRVSADWPQAFVLDQPLRLPSATRVSLVTQPADPEARVRLSLLR